MEMHDKPNKKAKQNETVGQLYQIYENLSEAGGKWAELEDPFKKLLEAVHSGEKEKILASQFITKFAEHFPQLDMAIANALFDLCEDDDVATRKQALKDLAIVAKRLPSLVAPVADAFAQVLQTDNTTELNIVQNSLMSLFYVDPKAALRGILAQIRTGEPIVRDRCFKFFQLKYKSLGPEVWSQEFEKCLFEETSKAIKAVDTREQFLVIIEMLNSTKLINTADGQTLMVTMIENMLDIKNPFCPGEDAEDAIAKLCIAVDFVFPFFHENNSSASLFVYFCIRVLPHISRMAETNETAYFSVLKIVVELSNYIQSISKDRAQSCLRYLLSLSGSFMHNPPNPEPELREEEMPCYQFSFLESFFYLINKLTCLHPSLMVKVVKHQDQFRSKITYLLRAVVPYNVKLRKDAQMLSLEQNQKRDRESLLKLVCFRTLTNVSGLGKVLYRAEGPCNMPITLSWKMTLPPLDANLSISPRIKFPSLRKVTVVKRYTPENVREVKRSQEYQPKLYQPPNGKFSGATLSYEDDSLPARDHYKRRRYSRRSRY